MAQNHLDDTRTRILLHFYDYTRKAITHYADLKWEPEIFI